MMDRCLASILSISLLCCGQDPGPSPHQPSPTAPELHVPGAPTSPDGVAPMISMSLTRVDMDFIFANLRAAYGMTVDGSAVPAEQRKRLVTLAVDNVTPEGLLDAIAAKTGTAWSNESGTVVAGSGSGMGGSPVSTIVPST